MNLKTKAGDFYNYFKECYKLDNKEFTVTNILSRKYPQKWFVSGREELYAKRLPLTTYTNKKVLALQKELTLYKFEKSLFYGCFFILGKNDNSYLLKDKRICAPLLLFPAEIETLDGEKFLKIEQNSFTINRAILSHLNFKNGASSKDDFIDEFTACIENDRDNSMGIKSIFDKYFDNIESSELALFPKVWSANRIKKLLEEKEFEDEEFMIVPAAGTILVQKSESSLKVLHDLEDIAQENSFSHGLDDLLHGFENEFPVKLSYYKSRLNQDQYTALENSYKYTNSVIVGPPGTGKTYTITSIISDAVMRNQSVLVVSKTRQAVDVLRDMLQNEFNLKNYLVHTTGHGYKRSLKSKIKKFVSGIKSKKRGTLKEEEVYELFTKLNKLEKKYEHFVENELRLSKLEFDSSLNLFEKWKRFLLKTRTAYSEKVWTISREMNDLLFQLESKVNSYTQVKIHNNISRMAQVNRKDLILFNDALETNSFTEYKEILKQVDQKKILQIFPIWLANLTELNAVLPLEKDLFDLVIIDEATQCDVASALPALYRAKRAVVVGDPNQLRHYSFISRDQQNSLREKYDLPNDKIFDYRNKSVLDLFISKVQKQEQVSFLREHFRSTPSLIEFSNQQFYDEQLEVIKSTPEHTQNSQIQLHNIAGQRDRNGENEIEAIAVIEKLDEIIQSFVDVTDVPSIGIISPFSSQVKCLNKILSEKYDYQVLNRFNIVCGTPFNFQGSEREIILLSFGVSDDSHPSAFNHINKPEVMNVAITRAKSFQHVFRSVSTKSLNPTSLLYQYFEFIDRFNHTDKSEPFIDQFQKEVAEEFEHLGFNDILFGYPIAGCILDLLIKHEGKYYFIDLIGYPGMYLEAFTIERYRTLARTGIESLPIHYSFWRLNKKRVMEKVIEFIEK